MSDYCRRPMCGHASSAHDRRGTRAACDVCACHHFVPDHRGTAVALVVLAAAAAALAALAVISGVHP